MSIAANILELIGKTPVVRLNRLPGADVKAELVAKLEYFNPASSIKDRLALAMIEDAENRGKLTPLATPPGVIVEPTSGNTGIGLALVAAVKGYRLVLTMPESMSEERKALLRGVGAELILTPAAKGMSGAIAEAERITAETPGAVMLSQFANPAGPEMHARTTAQELWTDCADKLDAVVAGIGTGGTAMGIARAMKEKNPAVRVFGVEPTESPVLSGGKPSPHPIQGIGAGFVPAIVDTSLLAGVFQVSGNDALATARALIREEGLFCGISAGAACFAALELGRRPEYAGGRIAFIVPDSSDRYLSTRLFTEV